MIVPIGAHALTSMYAVEPFNDTNTTIERPSDNDFISVEELLRREPDATICASAAFADALAAHSSEISEDAPETDMRAWIYGVFQLPETLDAVLACPEIATAGDGDTITFLPIEYTFPGGRLISVNYETQPKILKQRRTLGDKRTVADLNPSPRIGAADDTSEWSNTDPAWYAIMVVQNGALDEFAGPGKNYTISLDYIRNNIDRLYPRGASCTSKSALANDSDMINRAMTKTVGIAESTNGKEKDTNDYYVAGDVNLQWISYLEIGLDVVITVATFGGGTAIMGATKAARASKTLKNLTTTIRTLSKNEKVVEWIRASKRVTDLGADLKKLDRAKDAAAYTKKAKELENATTAMRDLEKLDDVKKYRDATKSFAEINQYRRALRGIKLVKRGNVAARTWRAFRAAGTGNKMLARGAKLARSSTMSGRIRDWLFQSTLRNAGKLARLERTGGLIYGAIKFVGGMYDWTETSTGDFTSGLDFAPLLLLSADDLDGQENVVNYGMWLMWMGNSIDPADDDAAYLTALDTAAKFHQDLTELQDDENDHACDVDIYVVRPVIRNPGGENPQLYYLIMNDTPWSTH